MLVLVCPKLGGGVITSVLQSVLLVFSVSCILFSGVFNSIILILVIVVVRHFLIVFLEVLVLLK